MSYEVELVALALLLYLYDSSALLHSNEAILACDRKGRWTVATGSTGFMLAGRALCVLSPWTPHRSSFRLHWDFDELNSGGEDRLWSERAREYARHGPMSFCAAAALFGLLPLGMFTPLGRYALIPALVLLYGSTILALATLRRSTIPAWSRARFVAFAFECLACPPFAVNMVRRITLAVRVAEPLPLAAVRLLDAEGWRQLRDQCLARLDEALQLAAEQSAEQRALQAQKQRLIALAAPP